MEWIESKIFTTSEGIEVIIALLIENNINNFQIEDDKEMKLLLQNNSYWDYIEEDLINKKERESYIKFYVSKNELGKQMLDKLKLKLKELKHLDIGINIGRLKLESKNVNDEDWIDNWKKYYKPFEIGNKILIKPVWENCINTENRIIFNIDPGYLFGTGLHQTTQLCIEEIEKYINNNTTVLDIGCGTGILSIISLMLGAKKATAIDIEKDVINIAYKNAKLNNIKKDIYNVISGDILTNNEIKEIILKDKYNVIIANIVADVIINLLNFVYEASTNKAIFISSGIIEERLEYVLKNLDKSKFSLLYTINKDGWFCIVCKINKEN